MLRQLLITRSLAISALGMALGISAQAGASRTFVATTGSDANVAANCGATTPCRTFGVALSVTNAGGEMVVLNSGGYGPATISQPVIITAVGIDASISAPSGANGLTINTSGNVTLTGLNLHGEGTGNDGVLVQQVGFLRMYNMLVESFNNIGVDFEVSGSLAIYSSQINDSFFHGLAVNNASAHAYVEGSSFDHNSVDAGTGNGELTIVNSVATNNGTGFMAMGGAVTLLSDRIAFNDTGMGIALGGTLYFATCLITNNTQAYNIGPGTMAGTNPGTGMITPGQTLTGTLSTAVVLQ